MREDRALDLRSFVDWMEAGRREAVPLLDGFLDVGDPSSWDSWLAGHPDARSVQFFEGVLEAAEHDPARALALTGFLLRHVSSVIAPSGTDVALTMLMGNAWCARGRALRDAGDEDAAVRAYEMAVAVFSAEPVLREEREETEREAATLPGPGGASRLLASTPFGEWPSLAQRAEMQHPGALVELSRETAARLHRMPSESLAIAQLAVTIAGGLSMDALPRVALAQIQGRAWKDLGVALRHVARHDEALSALARAGEVLGEHPTNLAFDLATVHLARAATLQEVNRFDESIAEFAKCKPVFEKYGDRRRLVFCGVFEGALLHRQHRYGEAIDVYRSLLAEAEATCEAGVVAILHNNIGHSATGLGAYDLAEQHLARAIALAETLDEPINVARSELARGRMLLHKGEVDRGVALLHAVRSRFLQAQLVEEAGLAGLDIVEAHLARAAAAEAEVLARQILREFTAARLNARAITALGYLSEAILARRASIATVDNVRQFIHRLRTEPDAEFAATA